MTRRVVDLTGTTVHRVLRNIAAETTPDAGKRKERRDAYDHQFGRCEHGGDPNECGEH